MTNVRIRYVAKVNELRSLFENNRNGPTGNYAVVTLFVSFDRTNI